MESNYYFAANTGDTCIGSPWQQVRVSVFILTTHKNWHTKGIAVQRTWAKRFNHYKFIYSTNKTSQNIDEVPSNTSDNIRTHQSSSRNRIPSGLPVNISEGREHLTAKSLHGFLYLYKHYLDSSEWFMKADDDTYVIVENLKLFLSKFEPTEPILIGYRFWHEQNTAKKGHMSGGAGYVLSKAALKLLVERGLKYKALCPRDGGSEDVILAVCLYNLGVKFIDAFDLFGNTRFHPFDPLTLLNGLPTKQGDFHYRNIMGNLKVTITYIFCGF